MTVQLAITFPLGTLVRLSASFTREPTQEEIDDGTADDADDWQPIDPDTVSARVLAPDATVSLHDYLGSPEDIERDDVGEYHLDITPEQAGVWYFRFESTGDGSAADEHSFTVAASAFP